MQTAREVLSNLDECLIGILGFIGNDLDRLRGLPSEVFGLLKGKGWLTVDGLTMDGQEALARYGYHG